MKKPDKKHFEDGTMLPLIDQFYTIQGEGFHFGKAAYFIRIGGCDIGCSWCDTKFSWNYRFHDLTSIEDIAHNVLNYKASTVVVTGGEPSWYNLKPLCDLLQKNAIETYIETSGAYLLTGKWNWICLSPKKQNPPHESIFPMANELKVIIQNSDDFGWAELNSGRVNKDCKLFLQPEWSHYEKIIPEIIEYVKTNPKWQISLQAHKFMHIP
ncbi:MAG: 7-carboxy-7-deazaguanine synthase QueE [Bacteroidales bacterium]